MRHPTLLLALITLATPIAAGAERPSIQAARTPTPPVIDGRIDESVWNLAPAVTRLEQQRPDNGEPSSEEIRVHVLYDDDALYIGADLPHKRSPVVRLLARRDTFLDSDWFGILVDAQRDRRSALGFYVNPDGVQLDESVTDDAVEDFDWDGTFQSATTVRADGWSAELRIPLSQFRFVAQEKPIWGVQLIRWVRARQEQARLTSHPRNEKGFVSRFGDLVGIDGIRRRPRLELHPYATAAAVRSDVVARPDPLDQRAQTRSDAGFDLRWTSRSNLTLNATINPDFGQVEVDPAILDLSGFELFFPEKRPFFVEGAKLFAFGNVATVYSSPFRAAHPLLFYSRRVGREPQMPPLSAPFIDAPSSTRILGAAKLTGRWGNGTTLSIVDAVTDEAAALSWQSGLTTQTLIQPRTNFFAARATKDFGELSRVGFLATSVMRQSRAETSSLADRANVAGIDGYTFFAKGTVVVDWMLVGSEVGGRPASIRLLQLAPAHSYQRPDADHVELDATRTSLRGWAGKAIVSKESGTWRYQAGLQSYSPGFDVNEAGFHTRSDLTAAHAQLTWLDVLKRKHTRNNRITAGYYRTANGDGDTLVDGFTAQYANTFINWWTTAATLSYGFAAIDDRETRGGPAIAKPAGWSSQLRIASNSARRFWIDVSRNDGRDDDGGSTRLTQATFAVRPRSNITTQLTATHAATSVASKYFTSVGGGPLYGRRYLFGRLFERRIEIAPRIDWTIRRTLTLQLFLQALAASGTYTEIGELQRSRGAYAPYAKVTRAGGQYVIEPAAGSSFTVADPDFVFRSFRGNAVLRWEIGPTTLFAIWNEGRQARTFETTSGLAADLRAVGDVPAEDRFLVKVSYRFELPR